MALFGKSTPQKITAPEISTAKISSATIITSCMTVTGDFKGTDTMHIDGKVIGNIQVDNTLVIGKSGVVEGNIEANNVIINGELKGTIKCEILEVMQTGVVSKHIEAKHITLDGKIEGEILATETINVLNNSTIEARNLSAKNITVHGSIHGTVVASELLEIGSNGFVEGKITVKNIKTEEGGRMIGTMSTYQEPTPTKKAPAKKTNAKTSVKEDDFFDK